MPENLSSASGTFSALVSKSITLEEIAPPLLERKPRFETTWPDGLRPALYFYFSSSRFISGLYGNSTLRLSALGQGVRDIHQTCV